MTLPSEIDTKTLTISPAISMGGAASTLEVQVRLTPSTVVWTATGQPLISYMNLQRTTDPSHAVILELPAADQDGFSEEFYYTITVRYLTDGRKTGKTVTKYFQPLITDDEIQDFDLIPTSSTPPTNKGPRGLPGKSAYEIAVEQGYSGTEADWIASLSNPTGSSGGSVHIGEGVPSFVSGAKVKDIYIDALTGILYKLEEG